MTTRVASCACGELRVVCAGEPVRVSMCHCLACQQRTGSIFGVQARFSRDQISAIEGAYTRFERRGDEGGRVVMHFCPSCGSTVFWELDGLPGFVAVAVGAFADPGFPAPKVAVYEARRHSWATFPDLDIEHWD